MQRQHPKKSSRIGTFFIGLLCGLLIAVFLVIGIAGYVIRNPKQILVRASDLGLQKIAARTVQSVPREYVGRQKDLITSKVQQFADAYANNRLSQDEIEHLMQEVMVVVSDQNVTTVEVEDILHLVDQYSK